MLVKEQHPLPFFLPNHARLLMLGSFPPPRNRWSMDFFYPNLQNDMWRIFGLIFFSNKDYFLLPTKKAFDKEKIVDFLIQQGIALGDTAQCVQRLKNNASDQFLNVIQPIDLPKTLSSLPDCQILITTGQKSSDVLASLISTKEPKIGSYSCFEFEKRKLKWYRMPSSSRAYPMPLTQKASIYQCFFQEIGW
jgi:G:T/U-mismatch repair DNA glycosylase